jgi:hypothetical protein
MERIKMPRRSKEWYIANNLPLPDTFERKTYNWYVQRGLTPPANLKVPKVIYQGPNIVNFDPPHSNTTAPEAPLVIETEAEIEQRIKIRFGVLEALVGDVVHGDMRALIVSGPPGLGKSFTVEQGVAEVENTRIVKGHASAKGLYELLFMYKEPGSILVFDDADSIFADERGLNLLKTALDTTEERVLSWLTAGPFGSSGFGSGDEDSEDTNQIPSVFTYEGSIIFITNLDFDALIARGSKLSKHLEALVSRAHYIDLMMKSRRDFVVRIKQVIKETDILEDLSKSEQQDVVKFIEDHLPSLREVSLRTALKIGTLRKNNKQNWQDVSRITCCKVT